MLESLERTLCDERGMGLSLYRTVYRFVRLGIGLLFARFFVSRPHGRRLCLGGACSIGFVYFCGKSCTLGRFVPYCLGAAPNVTALPKRAGRNVRRFSSRLQPPVHERAPDSVQISMRNGAAPAREFVRRLHVLQRLRHFFHPRPNRAKSMSSRGEGKPLESPYK